MMIFQTLDNRDFQNLKMDIETCPRLAGYYIIDLVAIPDIPGDLLCDDKLLDALFQHFDDQEWPLCQESPSHQSWDEYQVDREAAKAHLIEALVGGNNIGHTTDTITPPRALDFWNRFECLFSGSCRYYMGMGLGDPTYVFQYGVAIVDDEKAGILAVVEND